MVANDAWAGLRQSWNRSLKADNKSPRTVALYGIAAGQWSAWASDAHPTLTAADLKRQHVEEFLIFYGETHAPSTVSLTYRALQQWFGWMVDEDEVAVDPTARMNAPIVPEKLLPILTVEDVRALLKTCEGRSFHDRRDLALIRLLIDTGGRRGELCGLTVPDVDLDAQHVQVLGKGRRPRLLPIGDKTVVALDRYLRVRAGHGKAQLPALWLGENGRGPLQPNGLNQMLQRRGDAAGVDGVHPHRFRHTNAHRWLAAGGQEGDLMALNGWKSRAMVQRYGKSVADERAREAHRRFALGDQL